LSGENPLGKHIDIGLMFAPVDVDTSNAATGKRINMSMHRGVLCVITMAVGATDDVVIDAQQHTAYVSGTSADLDAAGVTGSKGVTEAAIKSEALLDNDEIWALITQTAASEITLTGATYGDKQNILAFPIYSDQLADTYTHMSVNVANTTASAHLMCGLYLPFGLRYQRRANKLPNLLRPGVANA
jgi:hypothetical protein